MVPEPRKTPANRGRQQPLTTSVMILQLLDRKMVKRSPFPVYFALIPLAVIQMQGLVELEVSYRWFRTCKDAEDWCMRDKSTENLR